MERPQKTIGREVELSGVGLHTGEAARLRLLPADPGTGVVFRRADLPGSPEVAAVIDNAYSKPRRSGIKDGDHLEIEVSAAAKTSEDYETGRDVSAKIWRLARP